MQTRKRIFGTALRAHCANSSRNEQQDKEITYRMVGLQVPIRPRVLLVDDDPYINTFLSRQTRKFDVETFYAPDAVQAYRIACRQRPSVIVTDYFMPNGDALFLLHKLRITPETEGIPLIVLSGRPLDAATERNLLQQSVGRLGVVKIMRKSGDMNELIATSQKYRGFHREWREDDSSSVVALPA